uniref:7TM GPCR serpentine receptor class x (Srx) domain-containing protein n=1 Tax=Acrobeloides nanus TaxID=290746 RepID=A0A914DU70_9BILA
MGVTLAFAAWYGSLMILELHGPIVEQVDHKIEMLTFVTGFLQVVVLLNSDFIVRFTDTKWGILLTTTISWICFHLLDGVIMAIFTTRWFKRRLKQTKFVSGTSNHA